MVDVNDHSSIYLPINVNLTCSGFKVALRGSFNVVEGSFNVVDNVLDCSLSPIGPRLVVDAFLNEEVIIFYVDCGLFLRGDKKEENI